MHLRLDGQVTQEDMSDQLSVIKDKIRQIENGMKADKQRYISEMLSLSEENSALKKDLEETKRSYKKLEDSKNSLTQEIKSMQKTLESLQGDQKSLSNVVSKLTAKAQDGGRSDSSSNQESDSDTESENEHESYINPRNRKDFREEDIKRSNDALPKPKENPIQTTTDANNKVKEIHKDGQRR